MNDCYVIGTGSLLPGAPVRSDDIQDFLGTLDGEQEVRERVLRVNGIRQRHYALDTSQKPTQSVVTMAARAVEACLGSTYEQRQDGVPSFLAAGTTYSPLSGPGLATLIHAELAKTHAGYAIEPVEISSHAGICTSGAAAIVSAVRSIRSGEHQRAVAVGSEHASEVLKSTRIQPLDDRSDYPTDLRRSRWFMSVFLRFMLSDGAGAILMSEHPSPSRVSFKVNWTYSRSFAHDTQLCMKLENQTGLLSQDVSVLQRFLLPRTEQFLTAAFEDVGESIDAYDVVLPHLSSFFFRRRMEKIMRSLSSRARDLPYWTNLATAGNTGAASIFVMLDEYLRTQTIRNGQRVLLFIPESGQFNFVLISLTAVAP